MLKVKWLLKRRLMKSLVIQDFSIGDKFYMSLKVGVGI